MKIFEIHETVGVLIPRGLPNITYLTVPFSLGIGTIPHWVSLSVSRTSWDQAVKQQFLNPNLFAPIICYGVDILAVFFPLEIGAWRNTSLKCSFLEQWKALSCSAATQAHLKLSLLTHHRSLKSEPQLFLYLKGSNKKTQSQSCLSNWY